MFCGFLCLSPVSSLYEALVSLEGKSTAAFHGARPPLGLEDPYTTFVPTEVGVKGDSNEALPFSSHFTMTVVSYFSIHHVLCASLTAGNQQWPFTSSP